VVAAEPVSCARRHGTTTSRTTRSTIAAAGTATNAPTAPPREAPTRTATNTSSGNRPTAPSRPDTREAAVLVVQPASPDHNEPCCGFRPPIQTSEPKSFAPSSIPKAQTQKPESNRMPCRECLQRVTRTTSRACPRFARASTRSDGFGQAARSLVRRSRKRLPVTHSCGLASRTRQHQATTRDPGLIRRGCNTASKRGQAAVERHALPPARPTRTYETPELGARRLFRSGPK
jgi:hypothetical protein